MAQDLYTAAATHCSGAPCFFTPALLWCLVPWLMPPGAVTHARRTLTQVPTDEAKESYKPHVVQCLHSNDMDDMEQNVDRIVAWCRQFRADRAAEPA